MTSTPTARRYEFDTWYGEAGGYGDSRPSPTRSSATTSTAPRRAPYFAYWGGVPHYYSYDVGGWHVVVLDTNSPTIPATQTAVGSAQYQWLDADLAAHQGACTIV